MNEVLFFKTFVLVGGMLVITSIAARVNKAYETTQESILTIGGTFLTLFIVWNQADAFPNNLYALAAFSFCIGWSMGPTITMFGESFKFRKYRQKLGLKSKTVQMKKSFWGGDENKKTVYFYIDSPEKTYEADSQEMIQVHNRFKQEVLTQDHDRYSQKWQNNAFLRLSRNYSFRFHDRRNRIFLGNRFRLLGQFSVFLHFGLCDPSPFQGLRHQRQFFQHDSDDRGHRPLHLLSHI